MSDEEIKIKEHEQHGINRANNGASERELLGVLIGRTDILIAVGRETRDRVRHLTDQSSERKVVCYSTFATKKDLRNIFTAILALTLIFVATHPEILMSVLKLLF